MSLEKESEALTSLFNDRFPISLDALEADLRQKKDATLGLIERLRIPPD
jgi:hypothetical protein